jgi:hypothetical protein
MMIPAAILGLIIVAVVIILAVVRMRDDDDIDMDHDEYNDWERFRPALKHDDAGAATTPRPAPAPAPPFDSRSQRSVPAIVVASR